MQITSSNEIQLLLPMAHQVHEAEIIGDPQTKHGVGSQAESLYSDS